jgi:predicted PurR-regulated permease PerM
MRAACRSASSPPSLSSSRLQWAKNFFVPLLLGIFIAYTLSPIVRWLERWRIKRAIGATLVTA